ncbi:MAG: hypothetical protein QXI60_03735, partial [Thermofilaceae archaeon]
MKTRNFPSPSRDEAKLYLLKLISFGAVGFTLVGVLAHQPPIDSFLPKYYAANVVAKIVCEERGNMRLKL